MCEGKHLMRGGGGQRVELSDWTFSVLLHPERSQHKAIQTQL